MARPLACPLKSWLGWRRSRRLRRALFRWMNFVFELGTKIEGCLRVRFIENIVDVPLIAFTDERDCQGAKTLFRCRIGTEERERNRRLEVSRRLRCNRNLEIVQCIPILAAAYGIAVEHAGLIAFRGLVRVQ